MMGKSNSRPIFYFNSGRVNGRKHDRRRKNDDDDE